MGNEIAKRFGNQSYTDIKQADKDQFEKPKTYDEAVKTYGKTVNGRTVYMPKEEWEAGKKELKDIYESGQNPVSASIPDYSKPAKKPTSPSWKQLKESKQGKGDLIAKYLNDNKDTYEVGPKTVQGMDELGYKQNPETGDWEAKVAEISETTPEAGKIMNAVTDENGNVDKEKATGMVNQYENKLAELGAGEFDTNGNFILKPTSNKKGWETWATLLSVGLTAVGLAMGVPIIPINFKAITGKDSRDAQIQALQQQYMNIKSAEAGKVGDINADVEAGNVAISNKDALAAQEKHAQATAATKDVLKAQTESTKDINKAATKNEKELIDTRTDAEIRRDEQLFKRDMQRLQSDNNFKLKYAQIAQENAKDLAKLQSDLSTGSALAIQEYANTGWYQKAKELGIDPADIAKYKAAGMGISPSDKVWDKVFKGVDTAANATGKIVDAVIPG